MSYVADLYAGPGDGASVRMENSNVVSILPWPIPKNFIEFQQAIGGVHYHPVAADQRDPPHILYVMCGMTVLVDGDE